MKAFMNRKYTTISIYAIVVFFICILIYKMVMSWTDSIAFIGNIIGILSPFLIALLISYFISPLVNNFEHNWLKKFHIGKFRIQKRKNRLVIAIFLSYIIFTSVVAILLAIIIPQIATSISDFSNSIDDYIPNLVNRLEDISFEFADTVYSIDTTALTSYITDNLPATLEQVMTLLPNIVDVARNFASGLVNIVLAYIVSIYLIYSKDKAIAGTKRIVIALFSPKMVKNIFDISEYANKVFSSFFIGKMIDSFIIGLICFIVLMIFHFPYALLISVIVGITNIIPYFGPLIGGAIGFVFLILISPVQGLWFILIIIILQQFDGNILGPWILGDSVGLSPFWVIFAIIIFGSMFGFVGMFLGAPLLSVIKYIISKPLEAMYHRKTALSIESNETNRTID